MSATALFTYRLATKWLKPHGAISLANPGSCWSLGAAAISLQASNGRRRVAAICSLTSMARCRSSERYGPNR